MYTVVFESIIRDKIIEYLEKYQLIKDSLHGFIRNKAYLTDLLVFIQEVMSIYIIRTDKNIWD